MSSGLARPSSLRNRAKYFLTINNTVWIYPKADIDATFANTTLPIKRKDDVIFTVPDILTVFSFIYEVYQRTAIAVPSDGYTMGAGTFLEDLGEEIQFQLETGQLISRYRLMRQNTDQGLLPTGGASPKGTIGYVITFSSYDPNVYGPAPTYADKVLIQRIG